MAARGETGHPTDHRYPRPPTSRRRPRAAPSSPQESPLRRPCANAAADRGPVRPVRHPGHQPHEAPLATRTPGQRGEPRSRRRNPGPPPDLEPNARPERAEHRGIRGTASARPCLCLSISNPSEPHLACVAVGAGGPTLRPLPRTRPKGWDKWGTYRVRALGPPYVPLARREGGSWDRASTGLLRPRGQRRQRVARGDGQAGIPGDHGDRPGNERYSRRRPRRGGLDGKPTVRLAATGSGGEGAGPRTYRADRR